MRSREYDPGEAGWGSGLGDAGDRWLALPCGAMQGVRQRNDSGRVLVQARWRLGESVRGEGIMGRWQVRGGVGRQVGGGVRTQGPSAAPSGGTVKPPAKAG
jgi:hypothetical protein